MKKSYKKEYKNIANIFKTVLVMKKAFRQVATIILLISFVLGVSGVGSVGYTYALFNDVESSPENIFEAGFLDIELTNTAFDGVISNEPDDESQFETNVSVLVGNLPTQYTVLYEKTGGSDAVCDALSIETNHDALSYSGPLGAFNVGTTTDFGFWPFMITVTDGEEVPAGETCEFDLVYRAWLDGVPNFVDSGYSDEERFSIVINTETDQSPVVLNEFLPNPDGPLCSDPNNNDCDSGDPDFIFDFGKDSDDMPQGEWVELYNMTGSPIDLSNWYVQDASGGVGNTQITNLNTAPATTTIPAHGFLVVYMNKPVWNNTGDVVKLFNGSDTLMDSYAYTSDYDFCTLIPTAGSSNTSVPGGGNNCGNNVPANKSYARIPDGVGAFVDPIPSPGIFNTEEGEQIALEMIEEELNSEITTTGTADPDVDSEAPVLTVQGNNPAYITLGSVYSDLGVVVTDNVNNNLGSKAFVDGVEVLGSITLDTSTTTTYTIVYNATDQAGNTGEAKRSVVVYDPVLGKPEEAVIVEEVAILTEEVVVEESVNVEVVGDDGSGGTDTTGTTTPVDITETEEETATTTPVILVDEEEENATTTPETVVDTTDDTQENATTTPTVLVDTEESNATTTPTVLTDTEEENATTTPVILIDEEGENATTTPEVIEEEVVVEPIVEEETPVVETVEEELPVIDAEDTLEEGIVEEETVVEEEVVIESAEDPTTTTDIVVEVIETTGDMTVPEDVDIPTEDNVEIVE